MHHALLAARRQPVAFGGQAGGRRLIAARWSDGEAQPLANQGRVSSPDARLADRKASQRVRVAHAPEAPPRRSIFISRWEKGRANPSPDKKSGRRSVGSANRRALAVPAQCSRNSPFTARISAGLISRECATVTECSGPSSFSSQNPRNLFKRWKFWAEIVVLPDIGLEQAWMIGQAVQYLRRGQAVAVELAPEILRDHDSPPSPGAISVDPRFDSDKHKK